MEIQQTYADTCKILLYISYLAEVVLCPFLLVLVSLVYNKSKYTRFVSSNMNCPFKTRHQILHYILYVHDCKLRSSKYIGKDQQEAAAINHILSTQKSKVNLLHFGVPPSQKAFIYS